MQHKDSQGLLNSRREYMHNNKNCTSCNARQRIAPLLIAALTLLFLACGEKDKPPFFTAHVIDLWNETLAVDNFRVLYWWQERGETPFLKPYEYHAKEFVVEVLVPINNDTRRVNVETRRIPFQNIAKFRFIRGEVENQIKITLKNGEEITAADRFPQILKKDKNNGFADYAVFVEGDIIKDAMHESYKQDLKKVKEVTFLKVTDQ
jgi:hypothetical protein